MQRTIVGWRIDEVGDHVAELSCLHGQHVRHQPPFRVAPWVEVGSGRVARIGAAWNCPLCDRTELPDGLVVVRTTATWDETTVPVALRREHRVAEGRWGRVRVLEGAVGFRASTTPSIDRVVRAGESQAIPPTVAHELVVDEPVRLVVDFLERSTTADEGGDPACWAHLADEDR